MPLDAEVRDDRFQLIDDELNLNVSPVSNAAPAVAHSTPEAQRSRGKTFRRLAVGSLASLAMVGGGFALGRATAPDDQGTAGGAQTVANGPADAANLLQVALELHRAGDLGAASKAYQAVLAVAPDDQFALYNLGLISQTNGDNAAAIDWYTKALAVDPAMTSAVYNRGLAYRDVGQLDAAIADLRAALAADPTQAPVLYNLGNVLIANGSVEEGTALIDQAVTIDPSLRGD
jgi:tetratricopeptide (TPR) repeat protein